MAKSKPYAKLRGKMAEKGVTQLMLAKLMGLSPVSINNKLAGKSDFTAKEMKMLKIALELNSIDDYFFAEEL